MSIEQIPQKNKLPDELIQALLRLRNGDQFDLKLFVEKNGTREKPYDLDVYSRKQIIQNVEGGIWRIEKYKNYEEVLDSWKLFADAGVLTDKILEEGINNAIQENMSKSEDEVIRINKIMAQGYKLNHYSEDFLSDFKKDITEKVKQRLGWDISLK